MLFSRSSSSLNRQTIYFFFHWTKLVDEVLVISRTSFVYSLNIKMLQRILGNDKTLHFQNDNENYDLIARNEKYSFFLSLFFFFFSSEAIRSRRLKNSTPGWNFSCENCAVDYTTFWKQKTSISEIPKFLCRNNFQFLRSEFNIQLWIEIYKIRRNWKLGKFGDWWAREVTVSFIISKVSGTKARTILERTKSSVCPLFPCLHNTWHFNKILIGLMHDPRSERSQCLYEQSAIS